MKAADYAAWCNADEVMVQLRGAVLIASIDQEHHVGPLVLLDEAGERAAAPPVPVLVGKLAVRGELLELSYRLEDNAWVRVALHPDDVFAVSLVDKPRIVG
jgi:hypothetical protein